MKSTFIIALLALTLLPFSAQAQSKLQQVVQANQGCENPIHKELEQLFTTAVLTHSKSDSKARFAFEQLMIIQSEMINFLGTDRRMHSVVEKFNADIKKVIMEMLVENTQDKNFQQKYLRARRALIGELAQCR